MLLLAPLLGLMPNATLAAVVIVYSVGLIQPTEFRAIRKVRTMEFRWALAACVGVLLFGTLKGIVVAIIVSMIGLASQTSHPRVSVIGRKRGADVLRPLSPEHPDDETFEGLLIIRPEGRLFFVNSDYVRETIRDLVAQHAPRVVALDMSRVPDLEYSALQSLIEGEKRLTESGVEVWLVGLNPGVLEMVRHSGLADRLGRERMLFNARAAIERYEELQPQREAAPARRRRDAGVTPSAGRRVHPHRAARAVRVAALALQRAFVLEAQALGDAPAARVLLVGSAPDAPRAEVRKGELGDRAGGFGDQALSLEAPAAPPADLEHPRRPVESVQPAIADVLTGRAQEREHREVGADDPVRRTAARVLLRPARRLFLHRPRHRRAGSAAGRRAVSTTEAKRRSPSPGRGARR